MDRAVLQRLIAIGFTLLGLAFAYVLFLSLTVRTDSDSSTSTLFEKIAIGETIKLRLDGERVWASRLNTEQRAQLGANHPCASASICVVSARGQSDLIDIVYSNQIPPQLPPDYHWLGGFVDPGSSVVYDLGGDAILPPQADSLSVLTF